MNIKNVKVQVSRDADNRPIVSIIAWVDGTYFSVEGAPAVVEAITPPAIYEEANALLGSGIKAACR